MRFEPAARGATRLARLSAIALGASIPISTALDNVLVALTVGTWLISGQLPYTIKNINKIKYLYFPLLLVLLLGTGMLYGASPLREALATWSKYLDLLWIPVFAALFRDRDTREYGLRAFAVSIALIVVLSYLLHWGLLPKLPFITGDAMSPTVFKHKITHNLLLAFGAFVFFWLGSIAQRPYARVIWISLALLAAINVVFLVKGATGYLTLGALVVLLAWQRLGWRGTAYGVAGVIALFSVFASVPSPYQERITLIEEEIRAWRTDQASPIDSSTGLRLEFYYNTLQIIAAHPWAGVGTGGFSRAYAQQIEGSGKIATQNPHNEFLHIAAQLGVVGLTLLMAMFSHQWRLARQLNVPMEQALTRALVVTMITGCLVNSLLLDHAEGLFYAWLSGLLCGGLQYGEPASKAAQS